MIICRIQSEGLTAARIVLFGIIGTIAIWFSHPAVFILAGAGTVFVLSGLARKEWPKIGWLSAICSFWVLSFATCYFISLGEASHNKALLNFWKDSFMPFPPMSLSDAKWFIKTFFNIFHNPVGLRLNGIAALTFIIGCVVMFSEKKEKAFILLSPLFFALLASGFHKYPFSERVLLFIVPVMLLFIAEGAEYIWDKTKRNSSII